LFTNTIRSCNHNLCIRYIRNTFLYFLIQFRYDFVRARRSISNNFKITLNLLNISVKYIDNFSSTYGGFKPWWVFEFSVYFWKSLHYCNLFFIRMFWPLFWHTLPFG
jgi:hypothetical protein